MQLQADLIGRPVLVSGVDEIGVFGAAAMAMAGMGVSLTLPEDATALVPRMESGLRAEMRSRWAAAVRQAMG